MAQSFPPEKSTPPSAGQGWDDGDDFQQFIAGQDPVDAAAAGWMVRRQDGLTPEEEAELRDWLAQDPAHGEALDQVEGIWGRMDRLPQEGIEVLKAGLQAEAGIPPQLAAGEEADKGRAAIPPARPTAQSVPGRRGWLPDLTALPPRLMPQFASAALAFFVIGGGWLGWEFWRSQPTFVHSYVTARGQQQQVQLPDGSTLWLDTATRADVALYRQRREVQLPEGQAQFVVQADPAQPFHVLAGPLRITVVGTRFSVRYTRSGLGNGGVSVVVEEGKVRVARADGQPQEQGVEGSDAVLLTAGQSVLADASGVLGAVSSESAAGTDAWREGRISFAGVPLAQVLAELERYGNTGLVVNDPAVAALRVHGSFDLRRLDAFMRALPQVLPVRLEPMTDGRAEIVALASH